MCIYLYVYACYIQYLYLPMLGTHTHTHTHRLPRWYSGKESAYQCWRLRRCGFDPWVGKIPSRRKWLPTSESFPGESYGQRRLASNSPWGCRESDMTENMQQQNKSLTHMYEILKI